MIKNNRSPLLTRFLLVSALMASNASFSVLDNGATWATTDAPSKNESSLSQYKRKFEEIARRNAPAVVRVLGTGAPGSGTIISKKGNTYTVVTTGHVVKGMTEGDIISIITVDGQEHRATKVVISPWIDLATADFISTRNYQRAKVGGAKRLSNQLNYLIVLGYPVDSKQSIFVPAKLVNLSLNPFDRPGGYTLSYFTRLPSLPEWKWNHGTVKGMSGGPIFDLDGRLVAIHGEADKFSRSYQPVSELAMGPGTGDYSGASLGIPAQIWNGFTNDLSQLNEAKYKVIPQANYESIDTLLLKATRALSEGRLAEALDLYNRVISRDPKEGAYYAQRASIKQTLGNPKGALDDYNLAVKLSPDHWQILAFRGALRSGMGDHSGAQADFDRSLSINSTYYKAEQLKMRDLLDSGRTEEAIKIGESSMQMVSLDSRHALVVGSELVRAYAMHNRLNKALSLASDLYRLQPTEALLALQVYQVHVRLGNNNEGLNFLRKQLPSFLANKSFIYFLSVAEIDDGNPKSAVQLLSRLDRLTPNDATASRLLCYALQKDGRPEAAIEKCLDSLRLEPNSPKTHRYFGLALGDLGRHEEASKQYTMSIEYAEQKSAIDYLNRAESLWRLGRQVSACADYRRALRADVVEKQQTVDIKKGWIPDFTVSCPR